VRFLVSLSTAEKGREPQTSRVLIVVRGNRGGFANTAASACPKKKGKVHAGR